MKAATVRALEGPIPNAELPAIDDELTVLVNGQVFPYSQEFDPAELAQFVVQAAGDAFSSNPTPTRPDAERAHARKRGGDGARSCAPQSARTNSHRALCRG